MSGTLFELGDARLVLLPLLGLTASLWSSTRRWPILAGAAVASAGLIWSLFAPREGLSDHVLLAVALAGIGVWVGANDLAATFEWEPARRMARGVAILALLLGVPHLLLWPLGLRFDPTSADVQDLAALLPWPIRVPLSLAWLATLPALPVALSLPALAAGRPGLRELDALPERVGSLTVRRRWWSTALLLEAELPSVDFEILPPDRRLERFTNPVLAQHAGYLGAQADLWALQNLPLLLELFVRFPGTRLERDRILARVDPRAIREDPGLLRLQEMVVELREERA